jgi:hypothetical protein
MDYKTASLAMTSSRLRLRLHIYVVLSSSSSSLANFLAAPILRQQYTTLRSQYWEHFDKSLITSSQLDYVIPLVRRFIA